MKILFISLGCDKNLVDSERMLGLLEQEHFTMTDSETEADVIVVNTCCFIGDAKEESIQNILEMAEYRKHGPCKALIVTGCLAQRYRQEVIDEIPEVDAVLGTNSFDKLIPAIRAALEKNEKSQRAATSTVLTASSRRSAEITGVFRWRASFRRRRRWRSRV